MNTIHNGRCYTMEFSSNVTFFATDNIIIEYKRPLLLLTHGKGQEIGLVGQFFKRFHGSIDLEVGQSYKVEFRARLHRYDENAFGCIIGITEEDYFHCAILQIGKNITGNSSTGVSCYVPMISYFVSKR